MCSKISEYLTSSGDPYPEGSSCVHSEIRILRVGRVCTRRSVSWGLVVCSKISEYLTCDGDPYREGWSCVHSEIRILRVRRVCTRARVRVWALRRVACTDLTSSGYNGNQ